MSAGHAHKDKGDSTAQGKLTANLTPLVGHPSQAQLYAHHLLERFNRKVTITSETCTLRLRHYPVHPLLGLIAGYDGADRLGRDNRPQEKFGRRNPSARLELATALAHPQKLRHRRVAPDLLVRHTAEHHDRHSNRRWGEALIVS